MLVVSSKSSDVAALKEVHLAAVRELQEANADLQTKMGDILTELER